MLNCWRDDPGSRAGLDAGLSDGNTYARRQDAQKIAAAYKQYLDKHCSVKVATRTGADPNEPQRFVFILIPPADWNLIDWMAVNASHVAERRSTRRRSHEQEIIRLRELAAERANRIRELEGQVERLKCTVGAVTSETDEFEE